jgi:hypothetical protein
MIHDGDPMGPLLSGNDIALQRVFGKPDADGRIPVRWMVKVDGEWHEAIPFAR